MTVSPAELTSLPRDTWKRLESGEETVFVKSENAETLFRLDPYPARKGGTVDDLFKFLSTQTYVDDDEMRAFAADVETAQAKANHPLVSPWDT